MQRPFYEALEAIFLRAVQEEISPDGKLLSDAIPQADYNIISKEFENEKNHPNFNFKHFFLKYFKLSNSETATYSTNENHSIEEHISELWSILRRDKDDTFEMSSLLPLPYPYVVPGGRFKEIYYWDSYFTMLGLRIHKRTDLMEDMVKNFAFLIDEYGYIPNGNRKYYLGRSQPPFFSLMVNLLAEALNDTKILKNYLPQMIKEAEFFNHPSRQKLIEGFTLTCYYDTHDTPRIEMYKDDLHLGNSVTDKASFYQNIRAACESGWDFSSRWLTHNDHLSSIQTREIVPIDLNCLLWNLEKTIAIHSDNIEIKDYYTYKAQQRKNAIQQILWSNSDSFFMDYNCKLNAHTTIISCAGLFPLYFGISSQEQVDKMIPIIKKFLVKPGGLVTTHVNTGQQWDSPNGWAPLQWIGVKGLHQYGYSQLAREIATSWTEMNERIYSSTGKLMEKYNVEDMTLHAGGGEYEVQDGFGWTNGVYLALKDYLGQWY